MLQITQLHAYYGTSQVLDGVQFALAPGEMVALLGRNGAGRSSTAKAIMGLIKSRGSVLWRGQQILGLPTYKIAQLGIGYVPEERAVFPSLTVAQNLYLGQKNARLSGRWTLADSYRMFPQLQERQHTACGLLSGGEQQMLALCRTLMGDPALLLADEPTEGLAPPAVEQVAQCLQALRNRGVAVLLIEQKRHIALTISDRCLVMGRGRIVFDGTAQALQRDLAVCQAWLEI
jgi:branched-chain amino acid transport system ATP-binding protein